MSPPSETLSLNRSVTVNFHNKSSKTLNRTSGDFERTEGLHNVEPPTTIQPGQSVQWDEKTSAAESFSASANYSFDGGSLSVWWDNPISGSNQYKVSCDPLGPFVIGYQGGSGTNATIDVIFYEIGYGATWYFLHGNDVSNILTATGDNAVAMRPPSPDDSQLWSFIDPSTGDDALNSSGNFKLINKKFKNALTAFMYGNNSIGLYIGSDGPDQYWSWGLLNHCPVLINKNCKLYLTRSGDGGLTAGAAVTQDQLVATQDWYTLPSWWFDGQ